MVQFGTTAPLNLGVRSSSPLPPGPLSDVRPIVPRSTGGLFVRIEAMRDALQTRLSQELAQQGLRGHVLRSGPFQHPCWVKVELWKPADTDALLTHRAAATVTLHPRPYHRFEVEHEVTFDSAGRSGKAGPLSRFEGDEAARLVRFLVKGGAKPSFSSQELRRKPWQFWKPSNKPEALSPDWLAVFASAVIGLGLLASFAGGIGIPLAVIGILFYGALSSRQKLVRTSGKPSGEPRLLSSLDSWQSVVFGAGAACDDVRSRLVARLHAPFSDQMSWRSERIWYWGLDGVIEREQVVVTLGRAIVFVHIHRYGDDLYVAWDGHMNRGTWVEQDLYQGIDRSSRKLAVVRCVTQGQQPLTEYDLSDANSLDEFVHAQLVQVVKQVMAEKKIDQELDFKVIRGERKAFTGTEGEATTSGSARGVKEQAKKFFRLS
jgi:hypothetical protein